MKSERPELYIPFAGPCLRGFSWHRGLRLHLTGNVFAHVCLVHFGWLIHRGPHLSNRPGNLNLLPKQLKGLSAWMEVQIVLHCTQTPLSEPAAKPFRLHDTLHTTAVRFSSTAQKQFPPKWPNYLPDLAGMFLGGCVYRHVIGWGVSVEVTAESRTSNFSIGLDSPSAPRLWLPVLSNFSKRTACFFLLLFFFLFAH